MKKRKKKARRQFKRSKDQEVCYFCKNKKEPNYKEYKTLQAFISDRAKILGKDRTGVCSKHQRKLSQAIKRTRHLGLLPFIPSI